MNKLLKFFLWISILASFIGLSSCSKGTSTDQINHILKKFSSQILQKKAPAQGHATAISMAVQCGNKAPIYVTAGTIGIKDRTPINKNSIFRIGSITKSFTAVAVLQMAKEKGFSLDDSTLIAKYFPEYPKWGNVTLRQLMNMTTGIPADSTGLPDDIFLGFTAKEYKNYISPTKLLDLEYKEALRFKSGAGWLYSNANYILLGQLIKRVTHQDPRTFIKKRIFDKLGMHNSYFPKDKIYDVPGINNAEIVQGYEFYPKKDFIQYSFIQEGEETSHWTVSKENTAGGIVSTPEDINVYVHALYNPGLLLDHGQIKDLTTLVSKKTGQPLLLKQGVKEFGFGFSIVGYYWPKVEHVIYAYNGDTNGYTFIYLYEPKIKLYLTYAVNVPPSSGVANFNNSLKLFGNLYDQCNTL